VIIYGHAVGYRLLEYYRTGTGGIATLGLAAILLIALCAVLLKILLESKVPGGISGVLFILYVMLGFLSVLPMWLYFGTVDFHQWLIGFYKCVLPISLVFAAYFAMRGVNQAYNLLSVIALINGLLGGIGLITYFLGDTWVNFYLQLPDVEKLPLHFGGVLRMTSIVWNPLVFGILMAVNGIMAWNLMRFSSTKRSLWGVVFCVSVVATVASFTRTGWIVLFVGVAGSSLLGLGKISRRLGMICAVICVTAVLVLVLPLPLGDYNNMLEAVWGHVEASFVYENPRIDDVAINVRRIASYPIGYGLGTAGYAALPTRDRDSVVVLPDYVAADNNYLSMLLQVGIAGVMLFVCALLVAVRRYVMGFRRARSARARAVVGIGVGVVVGMGVGAMFLNVWEYNVVPHVAYIVMGSALKVSGMRLGGRDEYLG